MEPGSFCEHARPICFQTDPKIVNTTAGVTEDVNVWITQCGEVTLSLIFGGA